MRAKRLQVAEKSYDVEEKYGGERGGVLVFGSDVGALAGRGNGTGKRLERRQRAMSEGNSVMLLCPGQSRAALCLVSVIFLEAWINWAILPVEREDEMRMAVGFLGEFGMRVY